jgi:hypothetical protein
MFDSLFNEYFTYLYLNYASLEITTSSIWRGGMGGHSDSDKGILNVHNCKVEFGTQAPHLIYISPEVNGSQ